MIQIYASLFDIYPTEGRSVTPVRYDQLADKDEMNHWHYTDWIDDIRANGVKYQVKLHPSGHVGDGNFRYWSLRHLWEKFLADICGSPVNFSPQENCWWPFVPIDPYFLFGMQRIGSTFNIRKEIWDDLFPTTREVGQLYAQKSLYTKNKTIPSRTDYPDIDMSTLGAGSHPFARVSGLKFMKTSEYQIKGSILG